MMRILSSGRAHLQQRIGAPAHFHRLSSQRSLRSATAPPTAPPAMNELFFPQRRLIAAAASRNGNLPPLARAPRVCILGGGFGGLCTAIRLETLSWPQGRKPEVTLVDQHDRFVFKPLMYELLGQRASDEEVAPEFSKLLAPYATRFVQNTVKAITPDGAAADTGRVELQGGETLDYDYLVVALGGVINLDIAEGAKENALPFASIDDYTRMAAAMRTLEAEIAQGRRPTVTIVGAGYAGVELASCVQNRLGSSAQVQIVSSGDDIMPGLPASLKDSCKRTLEAQGVRMRSGRVTKVGPGRESVNGDVGKQVTVELSEGGTVVEDSDIVCWTAGQKPTSKVQRDGIPFELNEDGGIATDSALSVPEYPSVFAVGDTAAAERRTDGAGAAETGGPWPSTAQVALQQADYAAWNVWASINGRPRLPFKYQHLGELMSLGSGGAYNAPIQLPKRIANAVAGSPISRAARTVGVNLDQLDSGLALEGWLGGAFRRFAYWYRQPTFAQKFRVGQTWLDALRREGPRAATK